MMTKSKLAETNTQLSTAMKQINNLAMLMNAQLSKSTITADVWPVHLDTTATMFKLGNQVCPVPIKMEKYNDKKSNNIPWVSDFFYMHNKGYKTCLKVYAGGKGKGEGTHMPMFLYLMKGPYDDELTWQLKGEFEIKMLNQISDSEHHSVMTTTAYANACADRVTQGEKTKIGRGRYKFIRNEDLNKTVTLCQYLKDDCLFLQVKFVA